MRVHRAVEGLTPGYFALVMATGILSVGMHLEGFGALSSVLLSLCGAAFVVLVILTGWRLVSYAGAVVEDFTDPRRGLGFFTFVAGTNVLGIRLGLAGFHTAIAVLLVVAGTALPDRRAGGARRTPVPRARGSDRRCATPRGDGEDHREHRYPVRCALAVHVARLATRTRRGLSPPEAQHLGRSEWLRA